VKIKFFSLFLLSLIIGETGENISNILTIDTVDPIVEVISPNGSELFWVEEIITWSATDFGFSQNPIIIYFSYDNGLSYNDSTEFILNNGSYNWTIPDNNFDSCRVKIIAIDEFGNTNYDKSDSSFTVSNEFSTFSLLSPSSFTIDMDIFPILEWDASFSRGIYDVWISESPMFNEELTHHYQTINTYLYPPIDLKTNMTYFWKISAEIGQDTVVADMGGADYWMFTTVPHTDFLHPMIDGEIQDHRTLIKENSPYYLSQTPHTLPGKNLTIEPGVELLFDENTELLLGGNLVANGSEQDSIKFTGYDENIMWTGIRFDDNSITRDSLIVNGNYEYISGNILNYVNIINTSSMLAEDVEFYISNSSFTNLEGILVNINSYLINNTFENGISVDSSVNMVNGGIYFDNNVFQNVNGNGIYTLDNAIFIDNLIQNCTGYGINGGHYFDNNQIINNGSYGINCSDSAQVLNNSISDNGGYGLNGGIAIYGNTISGNNGYAIHAGVNSAITNNTIENNIGYSIENGILIDGNTINNNIGGINAEINAEIINNQLNNNSGFGIINGNYINDNVINGHIAENEKLIISDYIINFQNNQIENNTAQIIIDLQANINYELNEVDSVLFDNNVILNNLSQNNLTQFVGGKIKIINNQIENNSNLQNYNGGSAIYIFNEDLVSVIENNSIINHDGNNDGGGIYVDDSDGLEIKNNIINSNVVSGKGGGIFVNNGLVSILENTITQNSASKGSAVYTAGPSTDIQNNIITNNSDGYAVWGSPIEFSNNNIYSNISNFIDNIFVNDSVLIEFDSTSTQYWNSTGATTNHQFITNTNTIFGDAQLTITIDGDYDNNSEYASVYLEGNYLSQINPSSNGQTIEIFTIPENEMLEYLADEIFQVSVNNNNQVNTGYGLDLHSVRLEFESNIYIENEIGNDSDSLILSNFYYNSSQPMTYDYNFWGTRSDQGDIDPSIYDDNESAGSVGQVIYQPILTSPSSTTPGQLTIVDSVFVTKSSESLELSNGVGDGYTAYIALQGEDGNPYSLDVTEVSILNMTTYFPLQPLMWETGENTGLFRGDISISSTVYDPQNNIMKAQHGDTLQISSVADPTKVFYLPILNAWIDIPIDSLSFMEDSLLVIDFSEYIVVPPNDSSYILEISGNDSISSIVNNFEVEFSNELHWYGEELLYFTLVDTTAENGAVFEYDSVLVIVEPVQDIPVTFDVYSELIEDSTAVIIFNGIDYDNEELTFEVIEQPINGVIMDSLYIPNQNYFGLDSLIYNGYDGLDYSNLSKIYFEIISVNDVPTIVLPDSISFNEDDSIYVNFYNYINDVDGDSLIISIFDNDAVNIDIHSNDSIKFSANENWHGSELITFSVSDGRIRLSASDSMVVNVNSINDLPNEFQLMTPENNAMLVDLTPTFTWGIPVDLDDRSRNRNRFIESYQFILNQDTTIITENSFIPDTPLTENMEYSWQVIAVDNDGGETSSSIWSFWTNSVNSSPSEFSLLTPLDDEETGLTPTFSWMESSDLDLYDSLTYTLKLGDDVSNLAGINLGSSTNYSLEIELLDNTQYFWQVIATDVEGATFMTSLHSFMVNSENDNPEGFSLLNPQNNEILTNPNEILFWDVSTDLDGDEINYILYLDQNVDPITVIDTIQTNYYQNLQIEEDELYFWKVVSIDENGGSTATEIWSFSLNEINEPPSEFSLISPDNDEIINTVNIQLGWEESIDNDFNDIVSYILEIGSSIENLDTINVGYDTSYITEELNDNTEYFWRITAIDNSGTSTINSGSFNQFIINVGNESPSDFSLITPTYESIESNIAPLFYWENSIDNDPEDIVFYELFIDMDSSFVITDPIELDSNGFDYSIINTVLNDNSEYYWKVNAKDLENETTTSERFLFYTDSYPEPPNAFNLVSPINDSHLDSNIIKFTWNSTTDNDPMDVFNYGFIYTDNLLDTLSFNYVTDIVDTSLTLELETGRIYYWHVFAIDDDSLFTFANGHQDSIWSFSLGELSLNEDIELPTNYAIYPAYPNPFNPITHIKFAIPENALISVIIYDINGRVIEVLTDGMVQAGYHNLIWDSGNNPSGLYFVKLSANKFIDTQKLMLVK